MPRAGAVVAACVVATVTAFFPSGSAHAAPSGPSEFEPLCTPTDPALQELSGMVLAGDRIYAIGDGGSDDFVFELDLTCSVQRKIPVPIDPFDVEDLAVSGRTLVLSDTGDNLLARETVAFITMDLDTGAGTLHRVTFPDGAHDAESLLLDSDGHVFVVTKELFGTSGVYTPVGDRTLGDLAQPGPTAMVRVGTVSLGQQTPLSVMFTGGSVSSDGSMLALRSYTDVYLYTVVDGGIGVTLTQTEPERIPLPTEPQGEAVAFSPTGDLLIGSESAGGPLPPIYVLDALVGASEPAAGNHSAPAQRGVSRWTLAGGGLVLATGIAGAVVFARTRRR